MMLSLLRRHEAAPDVGGIPIYIDYSDSLSIDYRLQSSFHFHMDVVMHLMQLHDQNEARKSRDPA